MQQCENITTGEEAAHYFKYLELSRNSSDVVLYNRVKTKGFYVKYQKYFDKLVAVFTKNNVNVGKYLRCFIYSYGKSEKDIPTHLTNPYMVKLYADNILVMQQRQKVYDYFMKSANNVAKECIENGYSSITQYLSHLIKTGELVNKYLSGKISKYYIVSIQNFQKIFFKMDKLSQEEFRIIYDRYDKLTSDVQKAFEQVRNTKSINTIKLTEKIFQNLLQNQ